MAAKRILCPVDFSSHSSAAIQYASYLASAMDARIYFLHVEEAIPAFDEGFSGYTASISDLDADEGELLKIAPTEPGIDYEHYSLVGHAAETILEFAKTHDIDMIVMGTHGRTGVVRLVLGSVAEMVVRRADCPVLTIKQPTSVPLCNG